MTTCFECRFSVGMCRCDRFKAYVAAKFADAPTEGDFYHTYPSLQEAQAGVRGAKRGGHGFVHDTVTNDWFGNNGGTTWRLLSEPVADESGGEGEKCAHCDGSGHGFTSSVCWACKGSGAPTTSPNPTNGDAVSEPEAIGGGEGERQWPDIGHDPMKAARPDDRYEASRAALREAYQRQQPHVPNQTALVWRWHLGAVLEMATRLQAITSRGAATPQPVSGDAVREALEAGRIVVEGRGNGTYDEAVEAICKLLAALNHGGTQG